MLNNIVELFDKTLLGEISLEDFLIECGIPPDMAKEMIAEKMREYGLDDKE